MAGIKQAIRGFTSGRPFQRHFYCKKKETKMLLKISVFLSFPARKIIENNKFRTFLGYETCPYVFSSDLQNLTESFSPKLFVLNVRK